MWIRCSSLWKFQLHTFFFPKTCWGVAPIYNRQKHDDIKPSFNQRAAHSSQPGEWSGSLLDLLGSWRKNRTNPGSRASGQDQKKGFGNRGTVPLMLGGGDSWGRWAPSHKTDYLDLVGAYLVSHMITCSTAAKWFVVKDFWVGKCTSAWRTNYKHG